MYVDLNELLCVGIVFLSQCLLRHIHARTSICISYMHMRLYTSPYTYVHTCTRSVTFIWLLNTQAQPHMVQYPAFHPALPSVQVAYAQWLNARPYHTLAMLVRHKNRYDNCNHHLLPPDWAYIEVYPSRACLVQVSSMVVFRCDLLLLLGPIGLALLHVIDSSHPRPPPGIHRLPPGNLQLPLDIHELPPGNHELSPHSQGLPPGSL